MARRHSSDVSLTFEVISEHSVNHLLQGLLGRGVTIEVERFWALTNK